MANAPSPTAPTWQSLRTLAYALVGAPVVILFAMYSILGSEENAFSPPLWALAIPVALGAAAATVVNTFGYRAPAIDPVTPAEEAATSALTRYQSLMIGRFAFSESVAIIGIALAFVVPQGGFAVLLLAVVIAEVLMWWHVVPNDGQVRRVQQSLEAQGARVPLRELLRGA
jgi:hypothetical protein